MKKHNHRAIQLFPYPATQATIARQRANDHIITVRLPKIERRLYRLGWIIAGAYTVIGVGMAVHAWHDSKVENWSLPRLTDGCHVVNNAKACAEIQRRTELRP